jgi:hypothetical protein
LREQVVGFSFSITKEIILHCELQLLSYRSHVPLESHPKVTESFFASFNRFLFFSQLSFRFFQFVHPVRTTILAVDVAVDTGTDSSRSDLVLVTLQSCVVLLPMALAMLQKLLLQRITVSLPRKYCPHSRRVSFGCGFTCFCCCYFLLGQCTLVFCCIGFLETFKSFV